MIKSSVAEGVTIYTDELKSCGELAGKGYAHMAVNHGSGLYVDGRAHTYTVEGFWNVLKGTLRGEYRLVSPKYLQSYVDEYAFRYGHRKDATPMFMTFLRRARPLCG